MPTDREIILVNLKFEILSTDRLGTPLFSISVKPEFTQHRISISQIRNRNIEMISMDGAPMTLFIHQPVTQAMPTGRKPCRIDFEFDLTTYDLRNDFGRIIRINPVLIYFRDTRSKCNPGKQE